MTANDIYNLLSALNDANAAMYRGMERPIAPGSDEEPEPATVGYPPRAETGE
jgi:hypothetical protein